MRAGVRYCKRGVDSAGNVANFVETEQIVRAGRAVSMCMHMHVYMCVCVHVYKCVCVYVCMCVCMYSL